MMRFRRRFGRIVVCLAVALPSVVLSEQIDVLREDPSRPVVVPVGGSVVVGSETSIVEVAVANPGIADPSMMSGNELRITGARAGRTTLSVIDARGSMTNAAILVQDGDAKAPTTPVSLPPMAEVRPIDVVDGAMSGVIEVPTNGAVIITTDTTFADLAFADTRVAYGSALSDQAVYVLGLDEGTTQLILMRDDVSLNTSITFSVIANDPE